MRRDDLNPSLGLLTGSTLGLVFWCLLLASLLAGCATATYEQQVRCAKVGGVPNMFDADLCVQATPSYGPGLGTVIQDSTDYATGGANRGANGSFCYGCQGGYAPPQPVAPPLLFPSGPNLDNSGRYVPNRPQRGY